MKRGRNHLLVIAGVLSLISQFGVVFGESPVTNDTAEYIVTLRHQPLKEITEEVAETFERPLDELRESVQREFREAYPPAAQSLDEDAERIVVRTRKPLETSSRSRVVGLLEQQETKLREKRLVTRERMLAATQQSQSRLAETVRSLGGEVRAVVPLIAELRREFSWSRVDAALALGRLGDRRAVGPLCDTRAIRLRTATCSCDWHRQWRWVCWPTMRRWRGWSRRCPTRTRVSSRRRPSLWR